MRARLEAGRLRSEGLKLRLSKLGETSLQFSRASEVSFDPNVSSEQLNSYIAALQKAGAAPVSAFEDPTTPNRIPAPVGRDKVTTV